MYRRHSAAEERLLARWHKLWHDLVGEKLDFVSRKRHPLDCGHVRCRICHSHKLNGHEPTRQEKKAEDDFRSYGQS